VRFHRKGDLGGIATIDLPAGYEFTGAEGAKAWSRAGGGDGSNDIGLVAPSEGEQSWLVAFDYDDIGYVKDDEKDDLAAAADSLLESYKVGTAEQNKRRAAMGLPPMEVVGWHTKPFYDPETHNLSFALLARSGGRDSVNYNSKLLGRKGVVNATLICDPKQLDTLLPTYKKLLGGFSFNSGQKYEEWKPGDRVAEYGLAALVAGGGIAIAAKTGLLAGLFKLLAKGGKLVIGLVVAVFAGIFWVFKTIAGLFGFGGSSEEEGRPPETLPVKLGGADGSTPGTDKPLEPTAAGGLSLEKPADPSAPPKDGY
jgi:uncharacterized membrane-anchored protein